VTGRAAGLQKRAASRRPADGRPDAFEVSGV
jgi:hypothetical protein